MKIRTIILLSIACLGVISCSEEFFEKYPSNQITENTHFQTQGDFEQAVKSCYVKLKSEASWHITIMSYRTDECQVESMSVASRDRYNIDHFSENSSTALLADVWSAWYNGIYRCNDVLDHMKEKDFPMIGQYRGELLFIRSWFYFNLYRTFGVVPIATTVVTPSDSKLVPRCTEEEMFSRLETDLLEAAELLPAQRSAEVARVTRIAAQTLLGKVYLTFGQYEKAEEILETALQDPNFGLMGTTEEVFDVKNKMNKEIIFALYYDKSTDHGHDYWFSSATSVKADRYVPRQEFKDLYTEGDNRFDLIDSFREILPNKLYAMKKWDDVYDVTYVTSVGNDFPHLRYADLVLMYAEACFRNEDYKTANEYLNKTRTRAGLSYQEYSPTEFLKALADERGKELALEGQRWYDLVRLGLAKEVLGPKGMQNHQVLFPIPLSQIEIINNDKILWQNPGF